MNSIFSLIQRGTFGSRPHPTYKIAILGFSDSGKDKLLRLLSDQPISKHEHGNEKARPFCFVNVGENRRLNLSFVEADVGFSEPRGIKNFRANYYHDADAVIWVMSRRRNYEVLESTEWLGLHVKGHPLPSGFGELKMKEGIPWLVVCNRDHETEVFPLEEMLRLMKLDELGIDYQVQPICTATGEGVADGLKLMVERLRGPRVKKRPEMIELNNSLEKTVSQ